MVSGINVTLSELIELRRWVSRNGLRSQARSKQEGQYLSHFRGRGMDFSEVRHYQAGDEIRHMEWRATARTGRPQTKVFHEERERPIWIITDFNASMFFGTQIAFKSVIASKLSALIAWNAIASGDRVGGVLFSNEHSMEFTPKLRESAILPFLRALSDFSQHQGLKEKKLNLIEVLQRLQRVVKPGSLVVLISDFYDLNETCVSPLLALKKYAQIIAYPIVDPIELQAPPPGLYPITDGQNYSYLDLRNHNIANQYQQFCDKKQKKLKDGFNKIEIPFQQILPTDNLASVVRKTFPRGQ